jgi:hypothetical protein
VNGPQRDYEERVKRANTAFEVLAREVMSDLDEEKGGVRWWDGHTDWKRIALISDYLLDAITGVAHSLFYASLSATIHREQQFADDFWVTRQWRDAGRSARDSDPKDFLAAIQRQAPERKRSRLIEMSAEHCFYHLVQALDRTAAALIIVGAIKQPVIEADWNRMTKLLNPVTHRQRSGQLELPGQPGRRLQDDLITVGASHETLGPPDWLPWLLRSRNTNAHRAPKLSVLHMRRVSKGKSGLLRPFYRQPGWDDSESLVAGDSIDGPHSLWLLKESTHILEGLVDSTTGLCTVIGDALANAWLRRRADPALLIQPGHQWPKILAQGRLQFPGYGPQANVVNSGEVYVSDALARRWQSMRMLDSARGRWHED